MKRRRPSADPNDIWWHKTIVLDPGVPTSLDHEQRYLVSAVENTCIYRRVPSCPVFVVVVGW